MENQVIFDLLAPLRLIRTDQIAAAPPMGETASSDPSDEELASSAMTVIHFLDMLDKVYADCSIEMHVLKEDLCDLEYIADNLVNMGPSGPDAMRELVNTMMKEIDAMEDPIDQVKYHCMFVHRLDYWLDILESRLHFLLNLTIDAATMKASERELAIDRHVSLMERLQASGLKCLEYTQRDADAKWRSDMMNGRIQAAEAQAAAAAAQAQDVPTQSPPIDELRTQSPPIDKSRMQFPTHFPPIDESRMQFQSIDEDTEEFGGPDFPLQVETVVSFGKPNPQRGPKWEAAHGELRVPLDVLEYFSPDGDFDSDLPDFM